MTTIQLQASAHICPPAARTARVRRASYWYSLFGQRVRSEIRLPVPEDAGPTGQAPDWTFRRMPRGATAPQPEAPVIAAIACEHGRIATRLHESDRGTWLWNVSLATCHIWPGTRTVDVYAEPGAAERDLQLLLTGQIAALLLQQQGIPALHASAVATTHGAIAFSGPKGRGKSTLAGFFLRRGGELLTDDLLPIQVDRDGVVCGLPSLPVMKAWDGTIRHVLSLEGAFTNVTDGLEKKLVPVAGRLPFHTTPVPVGTIFLLDRREDGGESQACSVRTLSGREALAALIDHTEYRAFLTPARAAALLPLYAATVRQARVLVLRYASGFARLPEAYAQILDSVAGI